MRNTRLTKLLCVAITLASILGVAFSASCATGNTGRIMPMGKVNIHQGGQKIGEFNTEAPLPLNSLLNCEGNCGVRFGSLYMLALDKSWFEVNAGDRARELFVKQGTVHFALPALSETLTFASEKGYVTVQQIILKASTQNDKVKGYFAVTEQGTEIGVVDGGALIVSTADGEQTITEGNRLLLAQAAPAGSGAPAGGGAGGGGAAGGGGGGGGGGSNLTRNILLGSAGLLLLGGGTYMIIDNNNDDDDDDDDGGPPPPASPVRPTVRRPASASPSSP